ncbi:GNAT family N-acetyltransferase [Rhodobacteraceae bacterium NNCM2]|nr:GNAT family N-acetyltransferase [Coraliihabitans acroporae]
MMAPVEIRRDDALGPDALAMIGESEAELASIYPPEVRYAFSPQELLDAGVLFLTAYREGRPVGCGGLAPYAAYGELKRIFVTQSARGTGVAEAIMQGLEDEARNLGLTLMRLETGKDSPAAIRFYRRCGYLEIGPFGEYEENGSSVFMEKPL